MSGGTSAGTVLQAALVARLKVAGVVVFDAPPVRGAVPYAVVEDPQLGAADAAGVAGRIGTVAISYRDEGERPVRLRGVVATVEAAVEELAADLGAGWRIAGLRLARSRIVRAAPKGGEAWLATSEFAVRIFRVDG